MEFNALVERCNTHGVYVFANNESTCIIRVSYREPELSGVHIARRAIISRRPVRTRSDINSLHMRSRVSESNGQPVFRLAPVSSRYAPNTQRTTLTVLRGRVSLNTAEGRIKVYGTGDALHMRNPPKKEANAVDVLE